MVSMLSTYFCQVMDTREAEGAAGKAGGAGAAGGAEEEAVSSQVRLNNVAS